MQAARVYATLFGLERPYEYQARCFEAIADWQGPLFVRAPCGAGKTEAVAAPFFAQFLENSFPLAARLIYVLPTQALCNQLASRLGAAASKLAHPLVVDVHHGAHPEDAFFLADVVVTTLDQFVYGYVRQSAHLGRHLDLPAGSIATAFVVFDEAHLYQSAYTFSILRAVLELLFAARVPFAVVTATMPCSLLSDFCQTVKLREIECLEDVGPERAVQLQLEERPLLGSGGLNDVALTALREAQRTLIVTNRVRDAQTIYEALCGLGFAPTLVHSRFTVADRKRKEEEIEEKLGRNGQGGIVVSTQVCEAGLNISCDLLLTDLAPADSLIQRLGRCARFGGQGRAIVFSASPGPYEEEHLAATQRWLAEHPEFNPAEYAQTLPLADAMSYRADDVAARDSLIDLYEATLYAEERARNLSVREGKYLFGLVATPEQARELLERGDEEEFRQRLVSLDYATAQSLARAGVFGPVQQGKSGVRPKKLLAISWNKKQRRREVDEARAGLLPLGTYLIDPEHYDSEKGVIGDDHAGA